MKNKVLRISVICVFLLSCAVLIFMCFFGDIVRDAVTREVNYTTAVQYMYDDKYSESSFDNGVLFCDGEKTYVYKLVSVNKRLAKYYKVEKTEVYVNNSDGFMSELSGLGTALVVWNPDYVSDGDVVRLGDRK